MINFPKVRSDVKVFPRTGEHGTRRFFLKDPRNQAVYEIGEVEFFICGLLDGETSPATVRQKVLDRFSTPLAKRELEIFVGQLSHQGLLLRLRAAKPTLSPVRALRPSVS